MKLLNLEQYKEFGLNENIKYHVENNLSITESIFRIGSDAYLDLVNDVRDLYERGMIQLSEEDQFIVEKLQTGKKGTLSIDGQKRTVTLDDPHIRSKTEPTRNLFIVYRPHPKGEKDKETGLVKAIALGFGEDTGPGKDDIRQKHQDPGRRKSFLARHNCSEKTDMYAAGWWSCNVHKFWKQLGLKTNDPW